MISTFVSLAAIVAGAPIQFDARPANQTAPQPAPAAIVAPAPVPAVVPAPIESPAARPLPVITVQSDIAEEAAPDVSELETPDAPVILAPETTETVEPLSQPVPESVAPEPIVEPMPEVDPSFVSPTEQRAILKAVGGALSSVQTAQGRFSQIDPYGTRATGSFALQRPGRMRFDYDDPVPMLIAADGVTVAVRDEELETVDRVPIAATPLNLLLDDDIDFETEAEVTQVLKSNGQIAITMRDRTGEADGELTLYLDGASYDLMGWRTLDGNDRLTFVELRDVDTGIRLNPRLFIIEEFEDEEDDDRR